MKRAMIFVWVAALSVAMASQASAVCWFRCCRPVCYTTVEEQKEYTVKVPEWTTVQKEVTVMVPSQETRTCVKKVCKMVPVEKTRTIKVDEGAWEEYDKTITCTVYKPIAKTVPCTFTCWKPGFRACTKTFGCRCGCNPCDPCGCNACSVTCYRPCIQPVTCTVEKTYMTCEPCTVEKTIKCRKWVPNWVEKEIPYTVCEPQIEEQEVEYTVCVCKPEKQMRDVKVCTWRDEVRTRTVVRYVPVCETPCCNPCDAPAEAPVEAAPAAEAK